jgi:hypothetical protein
MDGSQFFLPIRQRFQGYDSICPVVGMNGVAADLLLGVKEMTYVLITIFCHPSMVYQYSGHFPGGIKTVKISILILTEVC